MITYSQPNIKKLFVFLVIFCFIETDTRKSLTPKKFQPFNPWNQSPSELDELFGLIPNPDYKAELLQNVDQHLNNTSELFLKQIRRDERFNKPPKHLYLELDDDKVRDYWEDGMTMPESAQYQGEICKNVDYQPVIGILTQPVSQTKKGNFNYNDYILEVNDRFVKWAGSRTIAIPYDISMEDLFTILPQINGVLFTGGALDLIDFETNKQHMYYKTAKAIMNYSVYMKDVKNQEWPILGVCQGLEVISMILAEDDLNVLDTIVYYGVNRPVNWAVENVKNESRMFQDFPQSLIDRMSRENYVLHAHSYSVGVDTYNSYGKLRNFMKITQKDWYKDPNGKNIEFINAMEANDYPIFVSMYHPEYQLLEFLGPKRWNQNVNEDTEEIAFRFSLLLNRYARKNTNRMLKGNEDLFINQMAVHRSPGLPYPMIGYNIIAAYGYNKHPKIQKLEDEKHWNDVTQIILQN